MVSNCVVKANMGEECKQIRTPDMLRCRQGDTKKGLPLKEIKWTWI